LFLNNRVLRNLCFFFVVLITLTACIRDKKWYYNPSHGTIRPPLLAKTLVVYAFSDHRDDEVTGNLWCFLPFFISCESKDPRPENLPRHGFSKAWTFSPTEDIAKGITVELRSHNLFKKVDYSTSKYYTAKIPADLELHGTLHSTVYEQDLMAYGLSFFGGVAWMVGAPAFTIGNHLAFEISIHDQPSGKVIWENVYEGKFVNYASPLWRWRPLDFAYDKLLGEMMPAILADLEYTISVTAF
jgi:hypothetical protein